MKDENSRNMVLALVLAGLVLFGWHYFVLAPRAEQERLRQAAPQAQTQQTPQSPTASGQAPPTPTLGQPAPSPTPSAAAARSREAVIAAAPRVAIDTPRLEGSLSLRGGRIDDLTLKDYRETVDSRSPRVVLFNPSGTPGAFYAEIGALPAAGAGPVPTPDTLWRQEGAGTLSPSNPVTLAWDNGQGLTFRRTYAVDANYMFTVTEEVRNATSQAVAFQPYALIQRDGTPRTQGFYILHEGMIGVLGERGLNEHTYASLDKSLRVTERATTGWVGITDKYWAAAVIPDQRTPYQGSFIAPPAGQPRAYQSVYVLDAQSVPPGGALSVTHRVFAGAKEVRTVDAYDKQSDTATAGKIDRFELLIDWGWFYFITKPLFWVLDYFFHLFGNFGVSILLVTLAIKLFFFPLANKSYESMARMKKVQPELLAIRERFAEDKLKQQQAMMELYKKEKINPLSGCLPVIVQIPVFFALYKVLFVSIEMRHAPFVGWIRDLSAPDPTSILNLFGLLPFAVPEFLHIGAWPILMGITMWVQMKMNPEPPDQVQRMIFGWMPVVFTFMLASFPAGLVMYWAWNNLLSIAQQWVIMRRNGVRVELAANIKAMFKKHEAPSS